MKLFNIPKAIVLIFLFAIGHTTYAQDSAKDKKALQAQAIKSLVESKNFVFDVESVTPAGGRTRQLTPYYSLKIFGDTIKSDLPYYGRAYTAPLNPSEAGINFTSTRFDYKSSPRKKGGWDITIAPHDANDVRELSLTVFENGTASLFVSSNNKQNISYYGEIKSRDEMK
jgi:Domain of unknown function (DUF4251)